jgi:protoporphyrinogen oxidase
MKNEPKILIVGGGDTGLSALRIAELKEQHPDLVVVTLDEAKERGLTETFELKNYYKDLEPIVLKQANLDYGYSFGGGESKRAARRRKERESKKRGGKKLF